jgi:hypothetical protein
VNQSFFAKHLRITYALIYPADQKIERVYVCVCLLQTQPYRIDLVDSDDEEDKGSSISEDEAVSHEEMEVKKEEEEAAGTALLAEKTEKTEKPMEDDDLDTKHDQHGDTEVAQDGKEVKAAATESKRLLRRCQ